MSDFALGVIGAGNMAEAILRGALGAGVVAKGDVVVADPSPARRELFTAQLHVQAVTDNALPAACPHVLLAVKPQIMAAVLEGIAEKVSDEALVISIAAGVPTATIHQGLCGRGRIVRVMPNTPMLVEAGISALAAGPGARRAEMDWAVRLFAACGKTVIVEEPLIDAVTAVSGSGPAYFFYLIEAMVAAGVAEGLPENVARQLAVETCRGSAELLRRSGETPQALRAKVTSPNGTTQAAIETLDAAGTKDALVQAVRRAAERSRELGR
jgi:pyrroline-5-carboxylate reductase